VVIVKEIRLRKLIWMVFATLKHVNGRFVYGAARCCPLLGFTMTGPLLVFPSLSNKISRLIEKLGTTQ